MLNLTSMDSDLFWPSEFLPKKNFGPRGNRDESTHCVLDHAVFRKAHLLNRYTSPHIGVPACNFSPFQPYNPRIWRPWSCGQEGPRTHFLAGGSFGSLPLSNSFCICSLVKRPGSWRSWKVWVTKSMCGHRPHLFRSKGNGNPGWLKI